MKKKNSKDQYQKDILRLSLYFLAVAVALITGIYIVERTDYLNKVLGATTTSYLRDCKAEWRDNNCAQAPRKIVCAKLQNECKEELGLE